MAHEPPFRFVPLNVKWTNSITVFRSRNASTATFALNPASRGLRFCTFSSSLELHYGHRRIEGNEVVVSLRLLRWRLFLFPLPFDLRNPLVSSLQFE
jgi:hypothetical protein